MNMNMNNGQWTQTIDNRERTKGGKRAKKKKKKKWSREIVKGEERGKVW